MSVIERNTNTGNMFVQTAPSCVTHTQAGPNWNPATGRHMMVSCITRPVTSVSNLIIKCKGRIIASFYTLYATRSSNALTQYSHSMCDVKQLDVINIEQLNLMMK